MRAELIEIVLVITQMGGVAIGAFVSWHVPEQWIQIADTRKQDTPAV